MRTATETAGCHTFVGIERKGFTGRALVPDVVTRVHEREVTRLRDGKTAGERQQESKSPHGAGSFLDYAGFNRWSMEFRKAGTAQCETHSPQTMGNNPAPSRSNRSEFDVTNLFANI
ncbi:MAG: hypothetical protein PHQ05_10190 [Sterolibacterium sp.]|nr:hypothetical protein [Sterolibacterium sp.]